MGNCTALGEQLRGEKLQMRRVLVMTSGWALG